MELAVLHPEKVISLTLCSPLALREVRGKLFGGFAILIVVPVGRQRRSTPGDNALLVRRLQRRDTRHVPHQRRALRL